MTLIQIHRQNFWLTFIMLALVGVVAVAVVWLILLYNQTVSLARGANAMRETAKQLETDNSELKTQIFNLFSPEAVAQFAVGRGLVSDKNPEYSPILSAWAGGSSH